MKANREQLLAALRTNVRCIEEKDVIIEKLVSDKIKLLNKLSKLNINEVNEIIKEYYE